MLEYQTVIHSSTVKRKNRWYERSKSEFIISNYMCSALLFLWLCAGRSMDERRGTETRLGESHQAAGTTHVTGFGWHLAGT